MGLSRFLGSLLGRSQKSDAEKLAEEISGYALDEANETPAPQTEVVPEVAAVEDSVEKVEQETPEAEDVLDPIPSQMAPFMVEMIKGRSYKLCTCGQSKNHPFCDSSHEVEGCKHKPYIYKPKRSGYHSVCGCMESYDYPICDGTHDLLL